MHLPRFCPNIASGNPGNSVGQESMPERLEIEVARLVSEAAAGDGDLDIGEALKRLASIDDSASEQRRALIDALLAQSLRAGVNPQLPII